MLATLPHDSTQVRQPSVLTGVALLVALLVTYFTLGHLPSVWEHAFAWWFGLWGAPVTVPACPYPSCAYWIPR